MPRSWPSPPPAGSGAPPRRREHRPDEAVRCDTFDLDVPEVHAVEVVRGAETGLVRELVSAAARPVVDVVRLQRGTAAARHPAPPPVALPHPPAHRPPRRGRVLPGLDEMVRDPADALVRRDPSVPPR